MDFLIIGISGSLGAIARYVIYLLERSFKPGPFPIGTLVINLIGCLIAGAIIGFSQKIGPSQKHLTMLVSVGFVGSFTTFSALSVETLRLLQSDYYFQAMGNVLANIIFGIAMVIVGKFIASSMF